MRGAPSQTSLGCQGIKHKFIDIIASVGAEQERGDGLGTLPRECCLEQRTLHTQEEQQVQLGQAGVRFWGGILQGEQTKAAHLRDLMSHVTPVGAAAQSHHPKHPAHKG